MTTTPSAAAATGMVAGVKKVSLNPRMSLAQRGAALVHTRHMVHGIVVASLLVLVNACDSAMQAPAPDSASGDAQDTQPAAGGFVGEWTVFEGGGNFVCPSATIGWPNPQTVYVQSGSDADTVTSSNPDAIPCSLVWRVAGSSAELVSGTCSTYSTRVTAGHAEISASGTLTWSLEAITPDPICSATQRIQAFRKSN